MNEKTQQLMGLFEIGQRYTFFRIGEAMAMTAKQEITVKDIDRERGHILYVERGKRTPRALRLEWEPYCNAPLSFFEGGMFKGWDQPITCDTDMVHGRGGVMRGNACYNFIGTPEAVRAWIDANQINPLFDKASVLAIPDNTGSDQVEIVVYPELVVGGKHAVIDRVLAANEATV